MGDVPATVTQTLSVLNEDFFLPFLGGIALLMFGSAFCVLRHGGLPRWLGWVAILIGIVGVTPAGFVGFIAAFVWILIVSFVLYLATSQEGTAATPPTAQAP